MQIPLPALGGVCHMGAIPDQYSYETVVSALVARLYRVYPTPSFPSLPSTEAWRRSKYDEAMQACDSPTTFRRCTEIEQQNEKTAPGAELCLSYNPHICHGKKVDLPKSAYDIFHDPTNLRKVVQRLMTRVAQVDDGSIAEQCGYEGFGTGRVAGFHETGWRCADQHRRQQKNATSGSRRASPRAEVRVPAHRGGADATAVTGHREGLAPPASDSR